MHQIKGVTWEVFNILLAGLNHLKPKTDDDYFASAECRKEFKKFFREEAGLNLREAIKIEDGKPVEMLFEDASFRLLERAFKGARESGEVYMAQGAEIVVSAMDIMKNAEKIKKVEAEKTSA